MSKAEPMEPAERRISYGRSWNRLTSRQKRRINHKQRRKLHPDDWPAGKGRPTPRQRKRAGRG